MATLAESVLSAERHETRKTAGDKGTITISIYAPPVKNRMTVSVKIVNGTRKIELKNTVITSVIDENKISNAKFIAITLKNASTGPRR